MCIRPFCCRPACVVTVLIALSIAFANTSHPDPDLKIPEWFYPDTACGPRSLAAFLKAEVPEYEVKLLYKVMDKKPFAPTTLRDLALVAEKLGLTVKGYKLNNVDQLRAVNTYAILAVGDANGTKENPFHFVLLKEMTNDIATLIDTTTLKPIDVPVCVIEKIWSGYTLLLAPEKDFQLFDEPNESPPPALGQKDQNPSYLKDFGAVESGTRLEHTFSI